MRRAFFIGVWLVSVLSACSSIAVSTPGPTDVALSPAPATPIPFRPMPEHPTTPIPLTRLPGGFEYSSVAEALTNLRRREDVSIDVLQGWIIVREADGLTTWSFAPSDHPAHPAVAKRVMYRDQDGWHLKMAVRCEAGTAACDEFVKHFEALNEPVYQLIERQQ